MSTLLSLRDAPASACRDFLGAARRGPAATVVAAQAAQAEIVKSWFEFKNPTPTIREEALILGPDLASAPVSAPNSPMVLGFEGISQYQTAAAGRNFIPPDTMGAVGTTQFVQLLNGGFAVYDKANGTQLGFKTYTAFWAAAGGQQTNGDPRVMFNAAIQPLDWRCPFGAGRQGHPDRGFRPPTMPWAPGSRRCSPVTTRAACSGRSPITRRWRWIAMRPTSAPTISAGATAAGVQSWRGTTLNVLPIADLFDAGGPSVGGLKTFESYYNTPGQATSFAGFAIQGVNSNDASTTTGHIVTVSATDYGIQRYDILGAGTATPTRTAITNIATGSYTGLCGVHLTAPPASPASRAPVRPEWACATSMRWMTASVPAPTRSTAASTPFRPS